jgi:hypothetical protein
MAAVPGTPARSEAAGSAVSPFRWRLASGRAREQGKNFPEDLLAGNGLRKRLVRRDLIAVTPAILVPADVAGHCQVGHDAVGASLGDAQASRHVMQSYPRVVREKQQDRAVVTHESSCCPYRKHYHDFWKKIADIVSLPQSWWRRDEDLGLGWLLLFAGRQGIRLNRCSGPRYLHIGLSARMCSRVTGAFAPR